MVDKSINITNSQLDSSPINSGDNSTQTINIVTKGVKEDIFKLLIETIQQNIKDDDDKQDAIDHTQKLQEAISSNKKGRAQKLFGWLPTIIQTSSAGLQIASVIEKLTNPTA